MITVSVPLYNEKITHVIVAAAEEGKGLILVNGNNQKWNTAMILEITNRLHDELLAGMYPVAVIGIDANDQYKPDWLQYVDEKTLGQAPVWVGNIRDREKAEQALRLAQQHLVIAITHISGGSNNILDYFSNLGFPEAEKNILAVVVQEGASPAITQEYSYTCASCNQTKIRTLDGSEGEHQCINVCEKNNQLIVCTYVIDRGAIVSFIQKLESGGLQ